MQAGSSLRRPSVSLAASAAQANGQPRSVPERPLSAAIAEALGSPFHGYRVLTGVLILTHAWTTTLIAG